jgi:hypothetical protein
MSRRFVSSGNRDHLPKGIKRLEHEAYLHLGPKLRMGGARYRPLIRFHGASRRKDVCNRFFAKFEALQVAWSGHLFLSQRL